MIVRRLSPLSFAKVSGIVYAILGLIAGVMFALFSHDGGRGSSGAVFNAVFGVGALIFMPIGYGVLGFVFSLILAVLYNVVARFVGGIEIQTDQER